MVNSDPAKEPIAIIGVGCRFPGAGDLKSLWRILRDGVDAVGDYPGGRFQALDEFYATANGEQGAPVTHRGGFLKNLDLFDAKFFSISPREAELLDPQQRMLLEMSWEALEDAGIPLATIAGSRTGVFIGQWTSDFETCINELLPEPEFYSTTGSGRYAAAGRLAYHFDLRGPVLTLDTGCSSSLVAIHLACKSLRNGESDLALAGAVSLILRPEVTRVYGAAGMLSPDGKCKFGDASADGYVRSEGGSVVVLKRLSRALADGDPIHAVVLGTSVTNDGHSSGFLVSPSRAGQIAMIEEALRDAQLSAADVDYMEAHGTGTSVGDPVELGAIGAVLGEAPRVRPCFVGSVKTNLGHTEAAAGMAGLCKVILALQHATVPASLHFREPNPEIPWNKLPLTLNTETRPWPHDGLRRVAGLNSIGITGTNAHAIVESAPIQDSRQDDAGRLRLFVLSARSQEALEQSAVSWRNRMREDASWPTSLGDLAYTAAVRRTAHSHRLAVVARDARDLDAQLATWIEKHEPGEYLHAGIAAARTQRAVFVFPGQGGQWVGMGRELFEQSPVFREAIECCDRALRPHTGWSLIEEILSPDVSTANDCDRVQPTLFGLMIALAELWRSWGVEPEAVVGHSMGEAAAAVVCGALSLEDGAMVIAKRSQLLNRVRGLGLMAMTGLTFEEATEFARWYGGKISIAASNSPSSTVLSGDTAAMKDAIAALEAREIFCRKIQVDVASHSSQMDPLAPELQRVLANITPMRARVPIYSTSSGRIEDGLSLDASYWSRNLRSPVLFTGAVQDLLRDGFQTFIEINAHPLLTRAVEDGAEHAGVEVLATASQRRGKEQLAEILGQLGRLHVHGYPVDFKKLYPSGCCLRLPSYPWQRESFWPKDGSSTGRRLTAERRHSGLRTSIESSLDPGTWLYDVAFRSPDNGPEAAAWSINLALEAARENLRLRDVALTDLRFSTVESSSEIGQLAITPGATDGWRFRLSVKCGEAWRVSCEGNILADEPHRELSAGPGLQSHAVDSSDFTIACLEAAAGSLGATDDTALWRVLQIERVNCFAASVRNHARSQSIAIQRSDTCADAEIREEAGLLRVRMKGIRFEISQNTDCSLHMYEWKWKEIEAPPKDREPNGASVIVGDTESAARIAGRLGRLRQIIAPSLDEVHGTADSLGGSCDSVVWIAGDCVSEPDSAAQQVWDVCSLLRSRNECDASWPYLFLVTKGACGIDDALPSPSTPVSLSASQTAVWGLARVIAAERPEIRCVCIDLSPSPTTQEFELLQRVITSKSCEDQIAIRGTKCYGLRLERRVESDVPDLRFKNNATYLITGGHGDLGLALAEFIAARGASYIALVGRKVPDQSVLARIAHLEKLGTRIRSFQADVADEAAIASVLSQVRDEAPLKGIFHLAGITQDEMLTDISRDSLDRVMRPKVAGSWNLHRLTVAADLDYFVLYSSLAAVSSQPGQGSYAAANAYMDGLAAMRCRNGMAGSSIQWGPWSDAGMIRQSGAARSRQAWSEQGIGGLNMGMGIDAVHRLLARPTPVAFVSPVNWKRFAQSHGAKVPPQFSSLVEPGANTSQDVSRLRETLSSLTAAECTALISSRLKSIVATILKSKTSQIDTTLQFSSMGVDSLMAVAIARRATNELGVRLPVTAIFNFPTVDLLAEETMRRINLNAEEPGAKGLREVERPRALCEQSLSEIAVLSEEEALQSLVKVATSP